MLRKVRPEMPVVEMEIIGSVEDIGASASKALSPGSRYRYAQQVMYVLEDGERFATVLRALTKPKLQERIDNQRRYIANREVFADMWQDGDNSHYWSSSWRVNIGLCSR